jgi:1-deoxy-D-xylulose-5-phosphate synthase
LRNLIRTGLQHDGGPFAIRYPRDKAPDVIDWATEATPIAVGSWEVLREGRGVAVLAVGTMVEAARRAIAKEELNVTLVNCRFVKPMDFVRLEQVLDTHDAILTLEEGTGCGGFCSHVALFMMERGHEHRFKALYLPDSFVEHGSRGKLLELCGLSDNDIAEAIHSLLDTGPKAIKSVRDTAANLLKQETKVL